MYIQPTLTQCFIILLMVITLILMGMVIGHMTTKDPSVNDLEGAEKKKDEEEK